jgi:hypothetical protein
LGLAFEKMSKIGATPVFNTLVDEDKLPEPIFGMVLADSKSELIVGGRNTNLFTGDLTYVFVDPPVRISRGCPWPLF